MTELTKGNFSVEVELAEQPVLIDFFAHRCRPCQMMAPVFEELEREYGRSYKFCKVDTDAQEGLAQQFDILSVPTLVLMREGEIRHRISGYRSKDDIAKILSL